MTYIIRAIIWLRARARRARERREIEIIKRAHAGMLSEQYRDAHISHISRSAAPRSTRLRSTAQRGWDHPTHRHILCVQCTLRRQANSLPPAPLTRTHARRAESQCTERGDGAHMCIHPTRTASGLQPATAAPRLAAKLLGARPPYRPGHRHESHAHAGLGMATPQARPPTRVVRRGAGK